MGEMADYYADLAMQQQWEFDEEVADVLKKDEEFLFSNTDDAEDNLIKGIREYYIKYKKLSKKQKFCLARWIVENRGE
ncbi:MAG: hypothetical protein KIT33_15125 [Candidatus Kapabacteria bacterium]|jgi:sulfur relay (sulfurtransferase) DsrC/TusE family protein|nr:hypothetical protein [Ignavibacteriota bacterium]MCW5886301.1 hypothetical protein [Candidatus Kapabacteria bacterium]